MDQTIYFSAQEVVSGLIEVFTDPEEETFPHLIWAADCNSREYHVGELGVALFQLHLGALRSEVLTRENIESNLIIISTTDYLRSIENFIRIVRLPIKTKIQNIFSQGRDFGSPIK